jgi:hypothetical protein
MLVLSAFNSRDLSAKGLFKGFNHHGKTLAFTTQRRSPSFPANAAGKAGFPPEDVTGLISD